MLIVVATMHAEDTTANAVYVKTGERVKGVVQNVNYKVQFKC